MTGEYGNKQCCFCRHSLRYMIYFNSQAHGVQIPISRYVPALLTYSIDAIPVLRCWGLGMRLDILTLPLSRSQPFLSSSYSDAGAVAPWFRCLLHAPS